MRRRKLIAAALSCCMTAGALSCAISTAYARAPYDVIDSYGFKYRIDDGEAYLAYAPETVDPELVIPSEVSGCPVTTVGSSAFLRHDEIVSVKVPDSVKEIAYEAFCRCSNLEKVELPEGLETIGLSAFEYCYELSDVNIPESVKMIDNKAFKECHKVKEFVLSENVAEIGEFAFAYCNSLDKLTIMNENCQIFDSPYTMCKDTLETSVSAMYDFKILGKDGSTAQQYAEKYGIDFASAGASVIYGDVNCDGKVTIADAALLLQNLGNGDKYPISEAAKVAADVDGNAGLSALDALVIQQVDAGIYTKSQLPLK